MGLRGREAVETTYNWAAEENKLLAMYRNLYGAEPNSFLKPQIALSDAREAWINATVTPNMYILDIMLRNRKKFARDLPSAFKKETATGVTLMPAWEDEFQDVLRAHYTEACQRRKLEEKRLKEKARLKKKQEEAEKKIRELLGASFCWRQVEKKRKPPPKGCPSIFAFGTGEGEFTYKATRPHHFFEYSFAFKVPKKICTKKWVEMDVTGTGSCDPCEGYVYDELSIITTGAKVRWKNEDGEYKPENKFKLTHKDAKSKKARTKKFEFTLTDNTPEVVKLIVRSGSCFGNHRTWFYKYEKDTN